jgi:hypothetical protein
MTYSKKELKLVFNHIENTCEKLYKIFANETKKAALEFSLNPRKLATNFTDWQVDLNIDLEKLKEMDPIFFNEIKGGIHSFEKSAKQLIKTYKNKPEENTGSMQLKYFKELQDAESELKGVLSDIFKKIKNLGL